MHHTPEDIPIIETEASETIKFIVQQVARTAGLGVIKGPVGIGKSRTLEGLVTEWEREIRVIYLRSRPEIDGSILAFSSALLEHFNVYEGRTREAVQALGGLLGSYPFQEGRRPTVLVIDEAQGLKVNVLEMLRALYDAGDDARNGNRFHPAFGLVLCGNKFFLGRTGRRKEMDYAQFLSRITHAHELRAPSRDEFAALAAALCPNDAAAAAELALHGETQGNFRSMVNAHRQARMLAAGKPVTLNEIQNATFMMGDI